MNEQTLMYAADNLPIFQNKVFATADAGMNCPVGDVHLAHNPSTGIIENISFSPEQMKYDEDYQNEQACSPVFQKHLQNVDTIIRPHFFDKPLIEVGCGKGYFLEYLLSQGYQITGVDPAYEGDNPNVIKQTFDKDLAMQADGVVLRHVLEHIIGPFEFLSSIADSNGNAGIIYIEVPCMEWIVKHHAWFDIFYEHVNYFRADDFANMFGDILEIGHSFGGQYLYVLADLASLKTPTAAGHNALTLPADFMSGIDDTVRHVAAARQDNRKVAVWGAASKGVIYTNFLKQRGMEIDLAVDINPVKQGKYMAGSGAYIATPEDAEKTLSEGDLIIVTNSNYLEEIKNQTNHKYTYLAVDE